MDLGQVESILESGHDEKIAQLMELGRTNPVVRRNVATVVRKAAVTNQNAKNATASTVHQKGVTARGVFQAYIPLLPKATQDALGPNGRLKPVDTVIYSVKSIGGTPRRNLMDAADTEAVGRTNLNNRKLEQGNFVLVTEIAITSGVGTDVNEVVFDEIPALLRNGEFELEIGGKKQFIKFSMEAFSTANEDNVKKGHYRVDNPFFIPEATEIIPEIILPAPAAVNTWVKIQLIGVGLANR